MPSSRKPRDVYQDVDSARHVPFWADRGEVEAERHVVVIWMSSSERLVRISRRKEALWEAGDHAACACVRQVVLLKVVADRHAV